MVSAPQVDVGRHASGEGGRLEEEEEEGAVLAVRIQCLPTDPEDPASLALHSPAVRILASAVKGKAPAVRGQAPAVRGQGPAVKSKAGAVRGQATAVKGKAAAMCER